MTLTSTKLEEAFWRKERIRKKAELSDKLNLILSKNSLSFLSFEESDKIQLSSNDWPADKWNDMLYLQSEVSETEIIENIVEAYI
jgi:hypothetical protein